MAADKDLQKLPKDLALKIHDLMVKSRVLEERCIRLYKMGDAFFWIGGAGEEAFGVPLGLLVNKGQGLNHDWLHLHYRCTPTLVAMGMPMIDSIRLIMNRATDVSTGGRNFSSHYAYPKWNVAPVTSPIEVQYSIAIGTAWAQHREKAKGISIVTGGDAGTAEGDFATSLVWSSRKGNELPLYCIVTNNKWGISTAYDGQHGEEKIADRGKAFGMKTQYVNGNDVVESYLKLQEGMDYIRKTGKPILGEFLVSRLYGHSSASGANFAKDEVDPIKEFEQRLIKAGYISEKAAQKMWEDYLKESQELAAKVRKEQGPEAESVWDHIYANNENADWRKF
tara:strand:- start:8283 stop:9293 length:1011 start_codon:yes stop_codon:yes gene_type:complete